MRSAKMCEVVYGVCSVNDTIIHADMAGGSSNRRTLRTDCTMFGSSAIWSMPNDCLC